MDKRHELRRVRHESRRRLAIVSRVSMLTPKMRRIEFACPDLVGFTSAAPDDHIKLFFDDPEQLESRCSRDYTPRAFDSSQGRLTIDFALHDKGPATLWALAAKPGDRLEIGGPRGSAILADDFDFYLLIGDETAIPSIARRLEELRADVSVIAIILVDGPEEMLQFSSAAQVCARWVMRRPGHDDAALLCAALSEESIPAGEGYAWVAAEARVARQLRDDILSRRIVAQQWLKAAGYWVSGEKGASDKKLDD